MGAHKHNVNISTLKFWGGISLILLSVILTLNIGYVAKALAFPFYYLFGIYSYVLFAFLFVIGLSLTIKKHFPKFRFKTYLIAILISLGLMTFITTLYCLISGKALTIFATDWIRKFNFFEQINKLFASIADGKGYFGTTGFVDFFVQNQIGGGFISFLLTALLLDGVGYVWAIVIEWAVILIGLGILFVPYIYKKIKHIKVERIAERKDKVIIPNYDVISDADKLDEVIEESEPIHQEAVSTNYSNPINYSGDKSSVFYRYLSGNNEPTVIDETNRFFLEENKEEPEIKQEPAIENNHVEQMKLDFNEEQKINLELAQTKPEFVNPEPSEYEAEDLIEETYPVENKEEEIIKEEPPKKKERFKWIPPSIDLLKDPEQTDNNLLNENVARERQALINDTFKMFGINANCVSYTIGPSVTRYEIEYGEGELSSKIESKIDDIAIALSGVEISFKLIVPGTRHSAFEIANAKINPVPFKSIMKELIDSNSKTFDIGFGLDISGKLIKASFLEFPHLLLSGTTGSGKSVFLNSIFMTLIMRNSPDDFKMVIVDPKIIDTKKYEGMPHLLCPIINSANEVKVMLEKMVAEMERRYRVLADAGFSDFKEYNAYQLSNNEPNLPYILVSIDEFADLVGQEKEISTLVVKLVQKARAAGIHVILATQRPSTDVITGTIKGNLSTRVALMTAHYNDSMVIIGEKGAEKLLGKGDMLVQSPLISRTGVTRCQGCYVSDIEIKRVVTYLKEHYETYYDDTFMDLSEKVTQSTPMANLTPGSISSGDDFEAKYQSVKEWVMSQKFMSISKIQANMGVGFPRASKIFARLLQEGIVDPEKTSASVGNRVLVTDDYHEDDM